MISPTLDKQGDILRMLPRDVGAAAAYEAWRNWKYHYGIYAGPLAGDRERQLEALTGLAVSEGSTYSYSNHRFIGKKLI